MLPFPLRIRLGDGVLAAIDVPFATLVLAASRPRALLCLSPHEQDRLRILARSEESGPAREQHRI